MSPEQVRAAAYAAYEAGLCVVPPREDGTKAPLSEWKQWQTKRPDKTQMRSWYEVKKARHGVGLITGAASRGLEVLEFDDMDAYDALIEMAPAAGLSELIDRIQGGYLERSPKGGLHWFYYCDEIAGNTKLARRPKREEEKLHPADNVQVMIETRGEGGFIVVAPSYGPVHDTGRPYELVAGSWSTIATITPHERTELHRLCKSLDLLPIERVERREQERTGRPGDDFNARADWEDILQPHGWQRVYSKGQTTFWRRPGKRDGVSATTNHAGSDLFYVFTSSSDFEAERGYSRFSVYTILNHRGNHADAAKRLASDGYGAPLVGRVGPRDEASENAALLAPRTDVGDAELFVSLFGDRVRFDHERERFLLWRGHRWEPDKDGERYRLAVQAARTRQHAAIDMEDRKAGEELRKYGRSCESVAKQEAMLKALSRLKDVADAGSAWDMNPNLLGVANGVVDLATGALRPGKQDDLITLGTKLVFDPEARAPRWEQYLREVFQDDEEVIAFIQRAVGYSLTGSTKEQVMLLCHGKGSNGKSIFLNILRALGGEYATNIASDTIKKKKGAPENHPAEIAVLVGRRIVTCNETPEAASINDERIKALVGGDEQTARFMRANPFTFRPVLKLWLATNHLPKVDDDSDGFWRRMRLVPFERQFKGADRDNDLEERLMGELPGILAWAVRGAAEWYRTGLAAPKKVLMATLQYRQSADPLADFITERCILGDFSIGAGVLYRSYLAWCDAQGIRSSEALTNTAFGRRMGERFEKFQGTHGARLYHGLRLRSENDPDVPPVAGFEETRTPDLSSKTAQVAGLPDPAHPVGMEYSSRAIPPEAPNPQPATLRDLNDLTNRGVCICSGRHENDPKACDNADWWIDDSGAYHCPICHPMPEEE